MKSHRLARVSEAVRETVSTAVLFEVRDPRVKGVTVTRAEVSGDLQHAKVYVSVMGSERQQELALHGLRHAAGFLQRKLADRLQTRYTPTLQFSIDLGVKNSIAISQILRAEAALRGEPDGESGDEGETTTVDEPGGPERPSDQVASAADTAADDRG